MFDVTIGYWMVASMLYFTTEKASTFLSGNKVCQEMNVQNQEYQHFL